MKKLLPLILAVVGIAGGVVAGLALRPAGDAMPADQVAEDTHAPDSHAAAPNEDHAPDGHDDHGGPGGKEYVKLNNQFVIPMVQHDMVAGLVVMSLGLEVEAGLTEAVYSREPKLRDALLQVLFDHANIGGFRGSFTDSSKLDGLRKALTLEAQAIIGKGVGEVLIIDIVRQDV